MHRRDVVPGHEVVAEVVDVSAAGPDCDVVAGDRVGIAWLRHTCGTCRFCRCGRENLCPESTYTGWDADGGYAEFATVPAEFAYRLPDGYSDSELAPLLCAGIIGYRSLRCADVPPGGRLGIYGFGGSAHLTAQVAIAQGAEVHVMTRGAGARELALSLGAASVQGPTTRRPWRWTRRSCSRPWARWCRPHSLPWIEAALWQSRASTSATSRNSTTSGICSKNAYCAR